MKNAIILLFGLLVGVLLLAPLVYIATGRIKNPFENLTIANAGPAITQNFTPAPALPADTSASPNQNPSALTYQDIYNCLSKETSTNDSDILFDTNPASSKVVMRTGNQAEFGSFTLVPPLTWNFALPSGKSSAVQVVKTDAGTTTISKDMNFAFEVDTLPESCRQSMVGDFSFMHDSGLFMDSQVDVLRNLRNNENEANIVEKGYNAIAGTSYYWYIYSASGFVADPNDTYTLQFETLVNNRIYSFLFRGPESINGSYRSMFTAATEVIGGSSYGTTTPAPSASL